MLRSEKGMSRLELVTTIAVVMLILACTIFLAIGEDGFSIFLNNDNSNNTVNETNDINEENTVNETVQKNEIVPAEEKITNEIQNIIDTTVYQG